MRKSTSKVYSILVMLILIAVSPQVFSGDISKGKNKAAMCEGCHGIDGVSVSDIIPNLVGQKEEYLALSLRAFKNGSRKNGIMSSIVTQISVDDINDLAAYYSSLSRRPSDK